MFELKLHTSKDSNWDGNYVANFCPFSEKVSHVGTVGKLQFSTATKPWARKTTFRTYSFYKTQSACILIENNVGK